MGFDRAAGEKGRHDGCCSGARADPQFDIGASAERIDRGGRYAHAFGNLFLG